MPKGPGTGSCRHEKNLCGRNDQTHNMCCVMSRKHSCMTTKPRSRCPTLPGLLDSFRHSRASAKPANLTLRRQSVVRGLRRDGCMGRARQTRTQPGGEVSDQFGFISEVGHFSGRRNGAPAECSVRKMAVLTATADVLAGRSLAAYCGVLPVRSIAGYCGSRSGEASRPLVSCFSGGARAVLTVSAVCGRRNEGA